jgi:hypothetical protein
MWIAVIRYAFVVVGQELRVSMYAACFRQVSVDEKRETIVTLVKIVITVHETQPRINRKAEALP